MTTPGMLSSQTYLQASWTTSHQVFVHTPFHLLALAVSVQCHLAFAGDPLISETDSTGKSDTAINDDDSEVVAMIKELLETRIRPAVMEDGGDIVFKVCNTCCACHALLLQTDCTCFTDNAQIAH